MNMNIYATIQDYNQKLEKEYNLETKYVKLGEKKKTKTKTILLKLRSERMR